MTPERPRASPVDLDGQAEGGRPLLVGAGARGVQHVGGRHHRGLAGRRARPGRGAHRGPAPRRRERRPGRPAAGPRPRWPRPGPRGRRSAPSGVRLLASSIARTSVGQQHRGQPEPLGVDVGGVGGDRPRRRAAHIRVVGPVRHPADQSGVADTADGPPAPAGGGPGPGGEARGDHGDVVEVGAAGERVVDHGLVARAHPVTEVLDDRGHRRGHRAQVHRDVLGLGQQPAPGVEHRGGAVGPFLDVGTERRALQHRAHLLGDAHRAGRSAPGAPPGPERSSGGAAPDPLGAHDASRPIGAAPGPRARPRGPPTPRGPRSCSRRGRRPGGRPPARRPSARPTSCTAPPCGPGRPGSRWPAPRSPPPGHRDGRSRCGDGAPRRSPPRSRTRSSWLWPRVPAVHRRGHLGRAASPSTDRASAASSSVAAASPAWSSGVGQLRTSSRAPRATSSSPTALSTPAAAGTTTAAAPRSSASSQACRGPAPAEGDQGQAARGPRPAPPRPSAAPGPWWR